MKKHIMDLGCPLCIVLLALQIVPAWAADSMSDSERLDYRATEGIPDEEQAMSVGEVVGLLGSDGCPWAAAAIGLRCRLADDQTRGQIYKALAALVTAAPAGDGDIDQRGMAALNAAVILGQQEEHPAEAVVALRDAAVTAKDPVLKDICYMNVGGLRGPQAIQVLSEAIAAGPPDGAGPLSRFEGEAYQNLYLYLGCCGPEAAPVLFELAPKRDMQIDSRLWAALAATGNMELVMPFLLEKARTSSEFNRNRALHEACMLCLNRPSWSPETRRAIADMLVSDAGSPEATVRETVAGCLGIVGDETDIPLLQRMAADDPFSTRQVGSKGAETWDRTVYPIREAAAKSIEGIRRRLAEKESTAP